MLASRSMCSALFWAFVVISAIHGSLMQPPPASAAAGAAAPSAAAASTAAGAAAPSAAAGAAAAGGQGCGKRSRDVYIETRQCRVCGQHGHLQQSCPSCQAVDMQRRSSCGSLGTDMQEAELIQKSAEPLPIRHNGGIRWQNDSYGSGCEGMAAAAATATVTALTACRLNLADMHNDIMHIVELGKATATAMVQAQQDAVTALTATATTATATAAAALNFTLEELDVSSDSDCRDNEPCLCHWCKMAKLRQLGVRPSLRARADDVGLDTDSPGCMVCNLRDMGEISDDEWRELMGGSEHSSSDSQPEPEAATTAAAATAVEGAVEERVLGDLTSEPITNA